MKKEIILNEDESQVTICLSLQKRIMARDPRMTITTKMAQRMLQNENFKVDKCIVHDIINNDNHDSKHDGRWVFSLFIEEVPPKEVKVKESPSPKLRASKRSRKKKES